MNSIEQIVRYDSSEQRLLHGSISKVLSELFPHVEKETISEVDTMLYRLLPYARHEGNGIYAYITGSAAKRIIGGTPSGWRTPNALVNDLLQEYDLVENNSLQRLSHGGNFDLDVRFTPKSGTSFYDIVDILTEDQKKDDHIVVQKVNMGQNKFALIQFTDNFSFDIGEAPSSWQAMDDNCRLGYTMPASEFVTCVDVIAGHLYSEPMLDSFFISDEVFKGYFRRADLSQAIISTQRTLLNYFWWKRNAPYTPIKINPLRPSALECAETEEFWKRAFQNTQRREYLYQARKEEITAGFLLYLLCAPDRFIEDCQHYHLLQFLPLGERLKNQTLVFDKQAYYEKFANGTLHRDESGISIFADTLGISIPELVDGLTVL